LDRETISINLPTTQKVDTVALPTPPVAEPREPPKVAKKSETQRRGAPKVTKTSETQRRESSKAAKKSETQRRGAPKVTKTSETQRREPPKVAKKSETQRRKPPNVPETSGSQGSEPPNVTVGAPPTGLPPPPQTPRNYATVSVLYGTDRKLESEGLQTITFGAERGELTVGFCEVSIPRDHRLGELESPSIWRLQFRPDPSKHVVLRSTARMKLQDFQNLLQQRVIESGAHDALVFIHGYNVTFEDAARRTAQIAYDLQFPGVTSFYSWPSNGSALNYVADAEQARRAVGYLSSYLEIIFGDKNIDQVHLVAHSMGNQVLTAALQDLAAKMPTLVGSKIGQIALVAPDIDAEIFRKEIAPKIVGIGHRLTLYASNRDKALELSRKLHNYPRAGDLKDGVIIIKGMDTIDASAVDTSFLGHSYFAENRSVIADLFALVRKDTGPSDRFGMRPITAAGLSYWMFAP